jgi:hypothetical protein
MAGFLPHQKPLCSLENRSGSLFVEFVGPFSRTEQQKRIMREILDQSVAAIIGGVIAGLFAVVTLVWGFRHERKLKREEQSAKRKGASHAVVVEMAENFTRLKVLSGLAANDSPVGNMRAHLKMMQRRALDEYLPLLAEDMSLLEVRDIIAAYAGPSILLATLEGKWAFAHELSTASVTDRDAIRFAKEDFRRDTLRVAEIVLTAEERKEAGLEPETFV